jgi:hypothetical protein
MTGYRKDGMSLFRFGVLRYSWFMPNAESSVMIVVWWQKPYPGPEESISCVMPICCI